MNVNTGEVISKREMMEKFADTGKPSEEWVEINDKDMTEDQKERFEKNEQPVVKKADNKSILARIRQHHKRKLKNKGRNKTAKAKRRKNRK